MRVSVIVPTYKDDVALKLILDAFKYQTYKDFEVIVAEDNNSKETKEMLDNYDADYVIKHYSHEDKGNRKPIAVNNSIKMSEGEYIIFIDGDTIPYSTFVESHVELSSPYIGLCGRRVNLGDKVSKDLRDGKITAFEIEKNFMSLRKYILDDNSRHYEQGFYFKPNSIINKIMSLFDKNTHIVASNFSCYKARLLEVNGIDAGLPYAPSRDDTDLEWRLKVVGVEMKSCKFCANLLHLNHSRDDRAEEDAKNKILIDEKKRNNEYIAKNGIENLC